MKTLLSAMVGATLAFCVIEADAQTVAGEQRISLTIKSTTLAGALDQWAAHSGYQIIAPKEEWEIARKLSVAELSGTFTAQAALEKLLEGSPLTCTWLNGRAVSIRERRKIAPSTFRTIGDGNAKEPSQQAPFTDDGETNFQVAPINESAGSESESANSLRGVRGAQELEEVVVTGTNIRGGGALLQVISTDSAAIDRAGFTRVEDLTASLPQNFSGVSPAGRFATEGGSSLSTINDDRTSSVDLRGLGAESTLTLVDGVRQAGSIGGRVFDVSLLPLSMIERVDVVTGGHAAIYGSDAVAGVVNFISRRDFDGAETRISYGGASDGGDRLQASQLVGVRSDGGGLAVGYDYSREWPLDLADARLISSNPVPAGGLEYRKTKLLAQAETQKHAAFFSGHFAPADGIEFFTSAMYAQKRYEDDERTLWTGATQESRDHFVHPTEFYAGRAGADVDLPRGWNLTVTGAHSANHIDVRGTTSTDLGISSFSQDVVRRDRAAISSLSGVTDGPLFDIAGRTTHVALGVETRREDFRGALSVDGAQFSATKNDRSIKSAFLEVLSPVIDSTKSLILRRLELSAAGRYDRYDGFGSTFNPRFGFLWEAAGGIRFRAGYSRSFRAPALVESGDTASAFIIDAPDPQSGSGTAPLLISLGNNPELEPETADTWNVGLEFQPPWLPKTSLSLAYFHVEYTDRLEVPALSFDDEVVALNNEDRYPGLIDRTPDANAAQGIVERAQASLGFTNITATAFDPATQHVLDAFPGLVVFDNRTNNIARETAEGLDLLVNHAISTRSGELSVGANITYTLDHKRRITPTSPPLPLLNEVGKPIDLRARLNVGWTNDVLGTFVYVNYVDEYENPFSIPASEISSWTTVDVSLRADFTNVRNIARGFVATLTVANVFDEDPPLYPNSLYGVLYDTANASPLGRYVSLQLVKQW